MSVENRGQRTHVGERGAGPGHPFHEGNGHTVGERGGEQAHTLSTLFRGAARFRRGSGSSDAGAS